MDDTAYFLTYRESGAAERRDNCLPCCTGSNACRICGIPRAHQATQGQPHYVANRQLLADYRAYDDDELTRLCEVQRQVMGNPHKYSPAF